MLYMKNVRFTGALPLAGCLLIIVMNTWSCIKPYTPNVHSPATGYLVVEGNLNTAPAITTITLSRTVPLSDAASQVFENGAAVSVEGSGGSAYTGTPSGNGTYTFGSLPLDSNDTYRLNIKTSDGTQFLSEYVHVIPNPPIDSANATFDGSGAYLLVNAHNPAGNTRYYMWNYTETWEYHSAEESSEIYDPVAGQVVPRTGAQDIYTCWRTQSSTTLLIYSTAKLTQDVVSRFQLLAIPRGDQRLSVEYSLLVNQYALSDSAFDYLQLMQTNTENLGSIFDPLPSSLKGNIYCVTDPSQPVVGFVNASAVQSKRIFVQRPDNWNYFSECPQPDTTLPASSDLKKNFGGGASSTYTPLGGATPPGSGWVSNYTTCVDCTLMGGTTIQPSFWP
jgi:hypothetical protein